MASSERAGELEARLTQTPPKLVRATVQPGDWTSRCRDGSLRKRSDRKPGGQGGHEGSKLAQVADP